MGVHVPIGDPQGWGCPLWGLISLPLMGNSDHSCDMLAVGEVLLVFRSFSEGVSLYLVTHFMCPWEVSSGSTYSAISHASPLNATLNQNPTHCEDCQTISAAV